MNRHHLLSAVLSLSDRYFILMIALLSVFIGNINAQRTEMPDANMLLKKIDENMSSNTRHIITTMVIHGKRASRSIQSESWVEGEKKAFTRYLSPPREKGNKMLKLDKKLWIFSPSTDRTIRISGHMLKQSVMGSDLSYEDMMEDSKLAANYNATLKGEETIDNRLAFVLELTAKNDRVSYARRKLWVDQEKYLPLRQKTYAKSGKLLKQMTIEGFMVVNERTFPKKIIFKDMLKKGKGTEFIIETIEFDIPIAPHLFSKAALKK